MLAGKRLIIIEDEFLIALDMQRTLDAAGAADTVLARNFEEVATLGDGIGRFDLVILPPPAGEAQTTVAGRILAAGLAVVLCSGFHASGAGGVLADAEFLDKPFGDDELVAACERALARRGRVS